MSNEDPTAPVDFGPLTGLAGSWFGDRGLDVSPEPSGSEESMYTENILISPVGLATNAEKQDLAVLRYHQHVLRDPEATTLHDQTGYWMWDAAAGDVMFSLTIPRGVAVLAGGSASVDGDKTTLTVEASAATDSPWGILQSPFMAGNARTEAFRMEVVLTPGKLQYTQSTELRIYDRSFTHTDQNTLSLVTSAVEQS